MKQSSKMKKAVRVINSVLEILQKVKGEAKPFRFRSSLQ